MRATLLRWLVLSVLVPAASLPRLLAQAPVGVTGKVDRRVELLSIVARLAGYSEYVNDQFRAYAGDVDNHFKKYSHHPAVQFAREVRESNEIGFDAVMAMAVHLNPPPSLTPRVAFTAQVPDSRWGQSKATEFAGLLQQFYRDADCETFFESHTALYRAVEQRFESMARDVDFDWFEKFYGERPRGSFNLYIGLLNGGGNYGPKVVHPDGREDLYAIIGTSRADNSGMPVYSGEDPSLIIHEFNHSFINHLVFEHESQLSAAGERVVRPVAAKMKLLAYGSWQVVFAESLVRAGEIRYKFDHGSQVKVAYEQIMRERGLGFLWIEELSALLGAYEHSRGTYRTFRAFFPTIAGYFSDLSERAEFLAEQFEALSPRVTAVSPVANGAQDVDPETTQLMFTFDRPLDTGGRYSFNYGPEGSAHYPIEKALGFNGSGTTFTVRVKLKPDWEYSLVVTGRGFRSRDGYPLQPYTVRFKTRK